MSQDASLYLMSKTGGQLIEVAATFDNGAVVLGKVRGNSPAKADLVLLDPKGGAPVIVDVTIHDDGSIEFGNANTSSVPTAIMLINVPGSPPVEKSVTIAGTLAMTLPATVTLTASTAPTFDSAEVGLVDESTVAVRFSEKITASDYATGVVIEVEEVEATIESATRQSNGFVVHYVLDTPVANAEAVTWEYDAETGNIVDQTDGIALADVTAQEVTNNVPA